MNRQPMIGQGFENQRELEEIEMLKKMDEEARKEKSKINLNLSKLLSLIEAHNGTLDEIENKFKREFTDIKSNIKKIKDYQREQDKIKAENLEYQKIITNQNKQEPVIISDKENVSNKLAFKEERKSKKGSSFKKTRKQEKDNTEPKREFFEEDSGPMIVSTAGRNPKNDHPVNEYADYDSDKIASMDQSSTKERMNNRIKELYPGDTNVYAETPFDEEVVDPRKEEIQDESPVALVKEETSIQNNSSKMSKDQSLKAPREVKPPSSKIQVNKRSDKKLSKPSEQISPVITSNAESTLIRPPEKNNFTNSIPGTQAKVKTSMDRNPNDMMKDAEESLDKELENFGKEPVMTMAPVDPNRRPVPEIAENKNSSASKRSKSKSSAHFTSKRQEESQKSINDKDLNIPNDMKIINPEPITQNFESKPSDHKVHTPSEPSQNLPDFEDEEKKLDDIDANQLSQDSSENFSLEDNDNYQENMPRLEDNLDTKNLQKIDSVAKKSRKRKLKHKRSSRAKNQDMDVLIREQVSSKKDINKDNIKPKKSYHAYLEHPRLKHQPVVHSPKGKNNKETALNPLNLASRPKHK